VANVWEKVWPCPKRPLSNRLVTVALVVRSLALVTVCWTLSLFVQVTVVPTFTVIFCGVKVKLVMATAAVAPRRSPWPSRWAPE
jgi:hypothetical protein